MTSDVKHFFMFLLAIHIPSFVKCLSKPFAHFWNGAICLLLSEWNAKSRECYKHVNYLHRKSAPCLVFLLTFIACCPHQVVMVVEGNYKDLGKCSQQGHMQRTGVRWGWRASYGIVTSERGSMYLERSLRLGTPSHFFDPSPYMAPGWNPLKLRTYKLPGNVAAKCKHQSLILSPNWCLCKAEAARMWVWWSLLCCLREVLWITEQWFASNDDWGEDSNNSLH